MKAEWISTCYLSLFSSKESISINPQQEARELQFLSNSQGGIGVQLQVRAFSQDSQLADHKGGIGRKEEEGVVGIGCGVDEDLITGIGSYASKVDGRVSQRATWRRELAKL